MLVTLGLATMALGTLLFIEIQKRTEEKVRILQIPHINLITINDEEFSLNRIEPEGKTAILFFSVECEFCRKEIEDILLCSLSLTGVNWVFISISPQEELDIFMLDYPIGTIPNSRICIGNNQELFSLFDVTAPPSLFIYSAAGVLEHYKRGAVPIKTILEWLS